MIFKGTNKHIHEMITTIKIATRSPQKVSSGPLVILSTPPFIPSNYHSAVTISLNVLDFYISAIIQYILIFCLFFSHST